MLLAFRDGARRSAITSCTVLAAIVFIWCSMTVLYELTGFRDQAWNSIESIKLTFAEAAKGCHQKKIYIGQYQTLC